MTMYEFEDFSLEQTFVLGEYDMSADQIVQFARQFDPQLFHVDVDAAASGPYGELTASGWHTASSFVRLFVDAVLLKTKCLGSPGVDELRWLKPVAVGRLTGTASVESVKRSERTPTRGTVVFNCALADETDDLVLKMKLVIFVACKEPATTSS